MMTTEEILKKISGVKKTGHKQWTGLCPSHDDHSPSLSIKEQDGNTLINCFAGCDYKSICKALNISASDLFFEEAKYKYGNTTTKIKYRNYATNKKTFTFEYANGKKPTLFPLFMAPDEETVSKATRVYLCEGEKDALNLAKLGVATCSAHASGLPSTCDISPLKGKEIVIIIDDDTAGQKNAIRCAKRLLQEKINSGPILKWELPSWNKTLHQEDKLKDISDYLNRCEDMTKEKLEREITPLSQEMINEATGQQTNPQHSEEEIPAHEMEEIKTEPAPEPIHLDAFNTYIGNIILKISQKTEAPKDPILTQTLTKLGTALSAYATTPMSGGKSPILFNMIIGESGTGRKGTTLEISNTIVDAILSYSLPTLHSISTPEGIIQYAESFCSLERTGCLFPLLTIEHEEFAAIFKIAKRENNPIFQMIRRFWDSPKTLEVPTRKNPLSLSNPKISITGHITPKTIKKYLAMEEIDGGTINRFIFTWSQRDKITPYYDLTEEIHTLCKPIKEKITSFMGQKINTNATNDAIKIWTEQKEKYYDNNENIYTRHLGNMMRLATIFTILDPKNTTNTIQETEIKAAIAILNHSYATFNFILNKTDVTINEREILNLLESKQEHIATRNDIVNHFQRNLPASEISKAIDNLVDRQMVTVEKRKGKTKPVIVIKLTHC